MTGLNRNDASSSAAGTDKMQRKSRTPRARNLPRRSGGGILVLAAVAALSGCGQKKPVSRTDEGPTPTNAGARTGDQIYQEYCAVCHMPDGGGVPNFQPALRGNAIVAGDPAKLETVIRAGSAALRDRQPQYSAEMPPFGILNDDEMKAIVAYVRERFGASTDNTVP